MTFPRPLSGRVLDDSYALPGVQKWDRSLLPDAFGCFLLVNKVRKIQGPILFTWFWKIPRRTVLAEYSFPVSDNQIFGFLQAILVMITASWSGFLTSGSVIEVFSDLLIYLLPSSWLAGHFYSVLRVLSGGLAESLPLQLLQKFPKQQLHGIKSHST